MNLEEIQIRAVKDSDLNLILASWLNGAYYGSWMHDIDSKVYWRLYPSVVKDILRRCGLNVLVACWADAPDVVLGWVALEPEAAVAHFAFVKIEYRKKGVFNLLVTNANITQVSHITKPGAAIARKKGWTFNPFVA